MAAQPPSVQSLQNWEDAFIHYPLPTVRHLEKDLRKTIDDNRAKLRSLVGASYRDLLGTAERIIEMDAQMSTLERGLGEMGRRCDARALERVGRNWAGMRKDGRELAGLAQTRVLQGCLTVAGRVVKGKREPLLGAKVLVLARLLVKSVGEGGEAPAVLEELRGKLAGVRKRLLGYLERCMVRAGGEKGALAGTLCAYALVTSSTPKEVLRQFLQVRFRQLESKAEAAGEREVMQMLELYSQTLLDTKDLFPRRFAEALSQLSKVPLLRDGQVYGSYELSLDIYGQWIADDVRAFTPWVRHDQVTGSEISDALAAWTKQAHECLLAGLEEYLEKQDDLSAVLQSRHSVISKFMATSSRLRSETHAEAIGNARNHFLERMKVLVAKSAALPNLRIEPDASTSQRPARTDTMWDLAKDDMDMSKGAHGFRRAVVQRRYGRDFSINAEIAKLDAWVKRIEQSLESIESTRARKWDDDLDFDLEDLDDGDILQETLSKEDPKELMQTLGNAVEASASSCFAEMEQSGGSTSSAADVLRIFRELDMRVRSLQARLTVSPTRISLQTLHRNVALQVSQKPTDDYLQSLQGASHVATMLWDGTPPLPVQPTPATFKFLNALHRAMSGAGDDLWSAACVVQLRKVVDGALAQGLSSTESIKNGSSTLINGHTEGSESSGGADEADAEQEPDRTRLLQSLFDQLYLQQVFPIAENEFQSPKLASSIADVKQRADLDAASSQRMEKSAKEYWRRTYLLFGLLADQAKD